MDVEAMEVEVEGGLGCCVQQGRDAPGPLVQLVLCTTGQGGLGSHPTSAQFKRVSSIKFQPLTKIPGAKLSKPTYSEQPNRSRMSKRAFLDEIVAKNLE
eukprot:12403890-Karenia_brevis.AAC.1